MRLIARTITSITTIAAAAVLLLAGCGGNDSPAVAYKSCADVEAAGKAPLHKGDPGYSRKLDGDGDGTACDAGKPTPTPTPTTPEPVVAQQYATVEALKDAAVQAGYDCPAWVQDDVIPFAAESGSCTDESAINPDVFMTFASQADMDETMTVFESKIRVSGALLTGDLWAINSDDVAAIAQIAPKLGGTVEP